jgi:hypothetical protein
MKFAGLFRFAWTAPLTMVVSLSAHATPDSVADGTTSPAAEPAVCVPDCRSGYFCHEGQCLSACNPPCETGTTCTASGECMADGPSSKEVPATSGANQQRDETQTPADLPPPPPGATNVRFNSAQRNLRLNLRPVNGTDAFKPLCTAPCAAPVSSGTYELAIDVIGYRLARVPGSFDMTASEVDLQGRYRSRRGARIAGAVLLGVLSAAGIGTAILGGFMDIDNDGLGPFIAGFCTIGVGLGVGLPLLFMKPKAYAVVAQQSDALQTP